MKNSGLKLFSVAIALGLSFFVRSENNSSVLRFTVPIEIKNLPEDKVLLSAIASGAQVTVRGPSYLVRKIADSTQTFKVRIPPDPSDKITIKLREADLSLPEAINVLSIVPSEMEFKLEKRVVKAALPLIVPKKGKLSDGLLLGGILLNPNTVDVSGPESELEGLTNVLTEELDLSKLRQNLVMHLELLTPGSLSRLSVEKVEADIQVTSVQDERKFENLPIEVRSVAGSNYAIAPARAVIEISGARRIVEALTPQEIVPFVRLHGELGNGDRVKIEVELPNGTALVNVEPKRVKIVGVLTASPGARSPARSREDAPGSTSGIDSQNR